MAESQVSVYESRTRRFMEIEVGKMRARLAVLSKSYQVWINAVQFNEYGLPTRWSGMAGMCIMSHFRIPCSSSSLL